MTVDSLHLTPIIKVVGDYCNNRCGYCFYHNLDQKSRKKMSFELLESLIRQHAELVSGNLSFIWHGGEPLLAGLSFFQEVVRLQELLIPSNRSVRNSIQTNGTLITDEWATFFKENNFRVGVSLDGNEKSHDLFRVTHSGLGTFNNTVRGLEILRRHGIEPSVIQTITQSNASRVEEDFKFFVEDLGLGSFCINPYLDLSESNDFMRGQSLSNDELTQILTDYLSLWMNRDDETLRIREVDNFLAGVCDKRARTCSFNGTCHLFYTIDYDGGVYPCDRLSGDDQFRFGTLDGQTLQDIFHSEKWQDFIHKTRKLPDDCVLCEWKDSCNNGCTGHRVGGIDGKYFFCRSRKEVFTNIELRMNNSQS